MDSIIFRRKNKQRKLKSYSGLHSRKKGKICGQNLEIIAEGTEINLILLK